MDKHGRTMSKTSAGLEQATACGGFAKPSIVNFRHAAGVSLRTLYKYTPSRTGMVLARPGRSVVLRALLLSPEDHSAVMQRVLIDKGTIGREAGVIPVLDVVPVHFVAPLVGALAGPARLVVATIRQEFMANPAVIGVPHADIGVICPSAVSGCNGRLPHKGQGNGGGKFFLHGGLFQTGCGKRLGLEMRRTLRSVRDRLVVLDDLLIGREIEEDLGFHETLVFEPENPDELVFTGRTGGGGC